MADVLIGSRKASMPYAPSPHSEDETRRWVREVLLPTENVNVAEYDGEVVGVSAVRKAEDATWITQMYVRPSLTGRRIGTHLLRHALRGAAAPFRLYSFQENAGARRFYERYGFVPVAQTDGSGNEERCPDVLYEYFPSVADLRAIPLDLRNQWFTFAVVLLAVGLASEGFIVMFLAALLAFVLGLFAHFDETVPFLLVATLGALVSGAFTLGSFALHTGVGVSMGMLLAFPAAFIFAMISIIQVASRALRR